MEKKIKKIKSSFGEEITVTIDERLNNVKPGRRTLERVAEANRQLKKMKSLPK